jgi:hypothetical protein
MSNMMHQGGGRPISYANIWAAAILREKVAIIPGEDLAKSWCKTKYEVQN